MNPMTTRSLAGFIWAIPLLVAGCGDGSGSPADVTSGAGGDDNAGGNPTGGGDSSGSIDGSSTGGSVDGGAGRWQ